MNANFIRLRVESLLLAVAGVQWDLVPHVNIWTVSRKENGQKKATSMFSGWILNDRNAFCLR